MRFLLVAFCKSDANVREGNCTVVTKADDGICDDHGDGNNFDDDEERNEYWRQFSGSSDQKLIDYYNGDICDNYQG